MIIFALHAEPRAEKPKINPAFQAKHNLFMKNIHVLLVFGGSHGHVIALVYSYIQICFSARKK